MHTQVSENICEQDEPTRENKGVEINGKVQLIGRSPQAESIHIRKENKLPTVQSEEASAQEI